LKTETKTHILQLIEEKNGMRPHELREYLKISAQALHRHLKDLVQMGLIEARGKSPTTHYHLAGAPNLTALSEWAKEKKISKNPIEVSQTRDALSARLPRLKNLLQLGLSSQILPLVIATTGEVGNNSFDHNLGQWRDVPGCWVEVQPTGKNLWICIADRGQGIFHSLKRAHPRIINEQVALESAFEKIISGRAPEQRGNGLKFVRQSLTQSKGGGLACISGNARIQYGERGAECLKQLTKHLSKIPGTVVLMLWRLQ
jgi:DNA-binding HxlR family transcriptional regulator